MNATTTDATTSGATTSHATMSDVTPRHRQGQPTVDLVRWGPVVAGVVVGLGAFALVDALWFAIAAGGSGWVSGNLDWFVGGTAIGALLVAGFVAGLLSGARGAGAGLGNGVTTWGLLVVLSLVAGVPGVLGLSGALELGVTAQQALWTLFWSLLVGLGCAALGGVLGGIVHRPVVAADVRDRDHEPGRSEARDQRTTHFSDNRVADPSPTAPRERVEEPAGDRRV